jgi:hypothetical protein
LLHSLIILALALLPLQAEAQSCSNLGAASALGGGECLSLTQGGVTKRTTAQDIADLAGASVALTIGTTPISSGTATRVLYDNAGVLGEYTISGTGNVAMTTSPVFTTPNIGSATGSVSGNAGTATALETARTIGNVSFNGTANIVPETIAVIDSTDASSSIAMFDSVTGNLQPKTDAGLTYDATAGNLTATGTVSADGFIPTDSTATGNRFYLPTTNTPAISSNGLDVVRFLNTAAAANYITFKGASAGNDVVIGTNGSDTDIDIELTAKGTGGVQITQGDLAVEGGAITANSSVTATGFVANSSTATGNRFYLPSANRPGISANGSEVFSIGTNGVPRFTSTRSLTAAVNATTTTMAALSDLSVTLEAGKTYDFELKFFISAAAGGAKLDLNGGSATISTNGELNGTGYTVDPVTPDMFPLDSAPTALDTDFFFTSDTGTRQVTLNGTIRTTASTGGGTFIPRFAQQDGDGGTSTLSRATTIKVTESAN